MRIPSLLLKGTGRQRGQAHGEAFAQEIRDYTQERLELCMDGTWAGRKASREEVLGLAQRLLPAHQSYHLDLYEELLGLAEGAGISAAEAVLVSGFTDFIDVLRSTLRDGPQEDDCTAVLTSTHFFQTWDMHASATPFVRLLEIQAPDQPRARIFTTVGCLGQIGLNEEGIAIGITNLSAHSGQIGVCWPTVVRAALAQRNLKDALQCIRSAKLAGGHSYLLLDATGQGVCVEAMPGQIQERTILPLVQTNHCLHPENQAKRQNAPWSFSFLRWIG